MYLAHVNSCSESQLILGGFDEEYFTDPFTFHEMPNHNLWTVSVSHITVGKKIIPESQRIAVIDSGSSYLIIGEKDHKKLLDILKERHGIECC